MSFRRCVVLTAITVSLIGLAVGSSTATFGGEDGRITFNRVVGGDHLEIFSANPDGSDVQKLTKSNPGSAVISDWSPDGETIAFDSDRVDIEGRKRSVQIYLMAADGSGETQLTRGAGFHGTPGWSPDGASLAIDADWGDRPLEGIWIIPASDPDGVTIEDAVRVTTTPKNADFDTEPQYSPDGSALVFTRFKGQRESAIYYVNVDGSGLDRLTEWELNASDPDWSPDGQRIAYDSGDAGRVGSIADIYVSRPDGTKQKRLTDSPPITENRFKAANNPVWSPSGTRIMFTQFLNERNELVAINPDGSKRKTIVAGKGFPNKVDWGTHP